MPEVGIIELDAAFAFEALTTTMSTPFDYIQRAIIPYNEEADPFGSAS